MTNFITICDDYFWYIIRLSGLLKGQARFIILKRGLSKLFDEYLFLFVQPLRVVAQFSTFITSLKDWHIIIIFRL